MTAFFRNVYRAACRFIRILAPLFTALLFLSAFFSTCYAEDMTTQKVLTRLDNPLVSLAGGALFLLFLLGVSGFVCQKPRRRLPVLLGLVLLAYVLGGCILILFSRTVPAADALSVYRAAECLANNDTSVIHPTDSYLSYYPQQIGLVSFYEPLIRLWNRIPIDFPAYHFLKGIYVLLVCAIVFCQYRTVHLLWENERADCLYLLLAGTNLPLLLYSSFVYGEIPSFAAFSAGAFFLLKLLKCKADVPRGQKWFYAAAALLFLSASVLLRKNSLILIIAAVLVVLLEAVSSGRYRLLVFALACAVCSLSILPLARAFYERRADNTLRTGVPASAYFAMGMQESSRGNGWYNGFNFTLYQETGMDTELTNEYSRAAIRERLHFFAEHPSYAASFYLHKYLSQWADGTYASRQATLATFGGRSEFFQELYEGRYSRYFIGFCNLYQTILYLGALLFSLAALPVRRTSREETNPSQRLFVYLGLIGVFGGFLFHMIWEANSRYIFLYGLLLLPYAAQGISLCRLPENRSKTKYEK